MTPRFLIDRGSASVSAALVADVEGRWRLLASGVFPSAVDTDTVVRYVAERAGEAARAIPAAAAVADGWRDRERVEATTPPLRRIAVLAPNQRRVSELAASAWRAGWQVGARISPDKSDALATGAALGDPGLDAILLGAADPPRGDERRPVEELAAIAAAIAAQRPTILTVLSGAAVEHDGLFDTSRTVLGPGPTPQGESQDGDELARVLTVLGGQIEGGRLAAARSVAALASVLERSVESVDVGASYGSWFRAAPSHEADLAEGALEGFVLADGAMVPPGVADDEDALDEVIGWSPLRIDRPTHRDRLRDLQAHPWQDAVGEGALLRVAAGRAALARIEDERVAQGGSAPEETPAPELLVIAGGAFALAPGSAVALAAADTIRRPGMTRLAYDHARLLAPLGMLADGERLDLVHDLAGDLLMPLGSLLVLAGGRQGRDLGTLHVESEWASHEPQPLASGALRVIELPPGAPAQLEIETKDGRFGRSRAHSVGYEAVGGLGGLLVDTRGVPMRLPQHTERRREVVAQWQRSLWPGGEE